MESKGIREEPSLLKGEEVCSEHFSDITFIVIDNERSNQCVVLITSLAIMGIIIGKRYEYFDYFPQI